jgi:hypothetical protein
MKNAVFWDVPPCKSCVNRRFGGTYLFHLQARKIREARNQSEQVVAVCSQNVGSHKIHTTPHPRIRHSSNLIMHFILSDYIFVSPGKLSG